MSACLKVSSKYVFTMRCVNLFIISFFFSLCFLWTSALWLNMSVYSHRISCFLSSFFFDFLFLKQLCYFWLLPSFFLFKTFFSLCLLWLFNIRLITHFVCFSNYVFKFTLLSPSFFIISFFLSKQLCFIWMLSSLLKTKFFYILVDVRTSVRDR